MDRGPVDPAVGARVMARLKRNGGTRYDRFLAQQVEARLRAEASDLNKPEHLRDQALLLAQHLWRLLEQAEAIRATQRAIRSTTKRTARAPALRSTRAAPRRRRSPAMTVRASGQARGGPSSGALGDPDPPGPLRAGITVAFVVKIVWLVEHSRSEHDVMMAYLSLGTDLGGITILTMRDLDRMDHLEGELRGQYHHQLKEIADAITDEQRRELCSLLWYGRGDAPLDYCREHARETNPGPGYLFSKPLDIYLIAAALQRLGMFIEGREA